MKNQFRALEMVQKAFLNSSPWYVVLYVTAHCNSRCKFCFYWEEIEAADRKKELTLEELEKISRALPALYQLTLTGGEPFMRKDLDKIIEMFYRHSGARRFTIPSNGYFTQFMQEVLETSLKACPKASISINFSLDWRRRRISSTSSSFGFSTRMSWSFGTFLITANLGFLKEGPSEG